MYLGHSTTTDAAAVAVTVDAKLKRLEDWIQARDTPNRHHQKMVSSARNSQSSQSSQSNSMNINGSVGIGISSSGISQSSDDSFSLGTSNDTNITNDTNDTNDTNITTDDTVASQSQSQSQSGVFRADIRPTGPPTSTSTATPASATNSVRFPVFNRISTAVSGGNSSGRVNTGNPSCNTTTSSSSGSGRQLLPLVRAVDTAAAFTLLLDHRYNSSASNSDSNSDSNINSDTSTNINTNQNSWNSLSKYDNTHLNDKTIDLLSTGSGGGCPIKKHKMFSSTDCESVTSANVPFLWFKTIQQAIDFLQTIHIDTNTNTNTISTHSNTNINTNINSNANIKRSNDMYIQELYNDQTLWWYQMKRHYQQLFEEKLCVI